MSSHQVMEVATVVVSIGVVTWVLSERLRSQPKPEVDYTQYEMISDGILTEIQGVMPDLEVRLGDLPKSKGDLEVSLGDLSKSKGDLKVNLGEVEVTSPDLEVRSRSAKVSYTSPRTDLLARIPHLKSNAREVEINKELIKTKLLEYGIEISSITATVGPSVTMYKLLPAPGVKVSSIINLSKDIGLALASGEVMINTIQGDNTIGVEVPNKVAQMVSVREVFESETFQKSNLELPICIGKSIDGTIKVIDLAVAPHLLIAGATGKGKSVGINMIIASLLFKKTPEMLKLVMIDPKRVELSVFENIHRHFLLKLTDTEKSIITDVSLAQETLEKLCAIMDERLEFLERNRVRNLKEYNAKVVDKLPYIVVVIDEWADLIMTAGKGVEAPLTRLAQLARAIGIHLIVATQRPSVNVITGSIKANFPTRLSFQVSSGHDSKTILDTVGAENLIGKGDSLLSIAGGKLERIQCAYIDTQEVVKLVDYIAKQPAPESSFRTIIPAVSQDKKDPLFEEALALCQAVGKCNVTLLRKEFSIGFSRAEKLCEALKNEL